MEAKYALDAGTAALAPPGLSTFRSPRITLVVMAAGVLGGVANTTARRPPTPRRA
jgi:hypothetical protein